MAGDWMKIELELPDKPEVHCIASRLQIDPDAVVGKLIRIWQWFDKHTTNGNAVGVTVALPDRISGVTGFGEAMILAGWLYQNDTSLTMPKFDRHTSNSAKTRALTAKRVSKTRNATSVTQALPEKRREDIKPSINKSGDERFAMRIGWKPSEHVAELARQSGSPLAECDLPELISHWLTEPNTKRTQAEWDKALLQTAKHRKLRAASPLPGRGKPPIENFAEKDYGSGVMPL